MQLYLQIEELLYKDWDPIGLNDRENTLGEYQRYTPPILRLKTSGADAVKIAEFLFRMETVNMGLAGNKQHCEVIALKIFNL